MARPDVRLVPMRPKEPRIYSEGLTISVFRIPPWVVPFPTDRAGSHAVLVNQNQTFRQEVDGGYLWSPKRTANDRVQPFYETMREVSPGDLVFSFKDTRIMAIGVAQSYCRRGRSPTSSATWGRTGPTSAGASTWTSGNY